MIVISHSMPVYGSTALIDLSAATYNWQLFVAAIFRYLGQIGNAIFVVSSAWFLTDSKKVSGRKIIYILGDCFFISIAWLAFVYNIGYNISTTEIIKQFFPVTFGNNWFIGCYILLYAIHPLLNMIITSLTKETHLLVCVITLILYSFFRIIQGGLFYYTNLIGFITLYFLTAYIKNNLHSTSKKFKYNFYIFLIGLIGSIGFFALINFLGLHISALSHQVMRGSYFMNPFALLITFGMFNIFKNKYFINGTVNYISNLSLLIYVIQENYFMYVYIRNDIFNYIRDTFSFDCIVMWFLIVSALSFIGAIVVAAIYKLSIRRYIYIVCDKVLEAVEKMYTYISKKILKLQ